MTRSVPIQNNFDRTNNSSISQEKELNLRQDSSQYFKEDRPLTLSTSNNDNNFDKDLKIQEGRQQQSQNQKNKIIYVKDEELIDPPNVLLFRWGQFLEIFFIHFSFFNMLFIFSYIYIFAKYGKKTELHRNLMFWGCNIGVFMQYFIALLVYSNEFILQLPCENSFNTSNKKLKGYRQQLDLVQYFLIINIIITSIKYGFMHPNKYKLYCFKRFTKNQLKKEFLIINWGYQDQNIRETELINSILRQEIESSSFYLQFMDQTGNNYQKLFRKSAPVALIGVQNKNTDLKKFIYGPYLSRELIKYASQKFKYNIRLYSLFCSLFRSIVYILFSLLKRNSNELHGLGDNPLLTYYFINCQILQFQFVIQIFIFMNLLLREFKRKQFFSQQLTQLISAKRVEEYEYQKLYPTLNFVCDLSIRSWFKLRNILLGYGIKFYKRIEYVISFVLFFKLTYLTYSIVGAIYQDDFNQTYIHLMLFEGFVWLFLFFYLMKEGSKVNHGCEMHKLFIMKNLLIADDLSNKAIHYFSTKESVEIQVDNFMYQQIINYFKNVQGVSDIQQIQDYCKKIVRNLEEGLEQLEYIDKYNPISMMGIALNKDNLNKIMLGVISLSLSVAYAMYTKY